MKRGFLSGIYCILAFMFLSSLLLINCNGKTDKDSSPEPQTASPSVLSMQKGIILLATQDSASYQKVESAVKGLGGKVTVGVPNETMLVLLPAGKEAKLSAMPEIRLIATQVVDLEKLQGLTEKEKELLRQWNNRLSKTPEPTLTPEPPPPPGDARKRPPINPEDIEVKPPAVLPAGMENGSTFLFEKQRSIAPAPTVAMSGKVSALVIFPESNGKIDQNKEDWTSEQKDYVKSEIIMGMSWWASLAPDAQNLSFVLYVFSDPSLEKTSYEPIKRPASEEGLWIDEIMTKLGYTSGSYFAKVDSLNSWLKADAGADEAFTIFVVNDFNDADNKFPDGYFAYAYLGGPFMVMTYDNDGYGIANMDAVFSHEMGHIFHAYDEYASSGCECTESYNGCQNQNCENACADDVCCIMRGQVAPFTKECVCACTKGQIGWGCLGCGSQGTGCTSGICCNLETGLPKPPYEVCDSSGVEYTCIKGKPKGKCGDDVYERHTGQFCSGLTYDDCSGAIGTGDWVLHQACKRTQVCNALSHTCKKKSFCK